MQSGTILHLALLRKISNANRKNYKSCNTQKPEESVFLYNSPSQQDEQNFTISGWNTEKQQNGLKQRNLNEIEYKRDKKQQTKQFLFNKKSQFVVSQRKSVRTSQCTYRSRKSSNTSSNMRKQHKSETKQFNREDLIASFKEQFVPQKYPIPFPRKSTLNITCDPKFMIKIYKQNEFLHQNDPNNNSYKKRKSIQIRRKRKTPQSFTNFVNLHELKSHKFFNF